MTTKPTIRAEGSIGVSGGVEAASAQEFYPPLLLSAALYAGVNAICQLAVVWTRFGDESHNRLLVIRETIGRFRAQHGFRGE